MEGCSVRIYRNRQRAILPDFGAVRSVVRPKRIPRHLAGVLQRHPDLRVIVPHAGAALPVLAGRVDLFAPVLANVADRSAVACVVLDLRHPAVDAEFGAGHEAAVIRRQEQCGGGDLFRAPHPVQWYRRGERRTDLVGFLR